MKKLHLTRFAAMATVALMGSTAAWAAGTGDGYSWEDDGTLTLLSTDNNAIKITESDAATLNSSDIAVILVNRGAASASFVTLMLPVTVNVEEGYPIAAAYVPTGYHTGDNTLDFKETSVIEANKPYLVETNGTSSEILFEKEDGNYTIQPTGDNEHSTTLKNSCWTFTGTYAYKHWASADNLYGYDATDGVFVKALSATIYPMRAYLTCNNSTSGGFGKVAAEVSLPDVINVRFLDKNGGTLSIGTMNTRTGDIQMQDRYYDLKGRKLNGKPQNKIMYVNKKVIKH